MSDNNVTGRSSSYDEAAGVAILAQIRERTGWKGPAGAERDLPVSISPPLVPRAAPLPARTPASGSGVALRVHGDLSALESEWRAFESKADCTVFQAFDWLATWQRTIGARNGTVPAIVLGRDCGGQLLLVLPLAIETRGAVRRLTWLGSDLCDYNAPLLAEHFSRHVKSGGFVPLWRDITKLLRAEGRFRFDIVDLQRMPEMVGAQRNPLLDLFVLANPSGAHVATLGGSWDELYAAKRSSSTRKRERRQFKHLAEHGEVRFVDEQDREGVERTLATLIDQKARSFARMGVENLLARPGYREFFLAVATDPCMRDLVHVSRLDVGSSIVAASVGLRFRACYYLVLSSYQDGELSRFGPGRAHLHELLRHAIGRGFSRFDFTVGDEAYKRDWSDTALKLHDHLAAHTIRGRPLVALTITFRRAKRLIKQTPALWRAFRKTRSLARGLSVRN